MIIGLTGSAGAGKDTVADFLVRTNRFTKLSWAGPLKAALTAMGFPEPSDRLMKEVQIEGFDFSWRQAAQRLGTEWGRELDPEIWIKLMERRLADDAECPFEDIHHVISDVRFENEAAMIRRRGGVIWHIGGRKAELGSAAQHASEKGVIFQPETDNHIMNTGSLESLYLTVGQMLKDLA